MKSVMKSIYEANGADEKIQVEAAEESELVATTSCA